MQDEKSFEEFQRQIVHIERMYAQKLSHPISYYFEWRVHPYNLVFDETKVLDPEIKAIIIETYNTIFNSLSSY